MTDGATQSVAKSFYVRRVRPDGSEGWTGSIRSFKQASKEADAWRNIGWSAEVLGNSPAIRELVRRWEKAKVTR